MNDRPDVTGRRSFLGTLAAGATALGLSHLTFAKEAKAAMALPNTPPDGRSMRGSTRSKESIARCMMLLRFMKGWPLCGHAYS